MPQVHACICRTYQSTKAAVNKLRQDLLPLHLAELPMQARNLHAACLQLELRVLKMHNGKQHIRLAETGDRRYVGRLWYVCCCYSTVVQPFGTQSTTFRRCWKFMKTRHRCASNAWMVRRRRSTRRWGGVTTYMWRMCGGSAAPA